jgi:predicted ATPase/class 3 adenylate cyclase
MDRAGGNALTPSGTVTFLFTDIEGSTPLWDSFPDAMGAALARHDEIVRSAIDANGGHVFSTAGDGFGAVFSRAANAIAAGLAVQRELSAEEWVGGPVLRVRMGMHTGEAEERDGDFFGPAVNRAARIMGAANGGQVLVSDLTSGLVEHLTDVKLVDLGAIELKGVIEPVHVYGVAGDGHEWLDTPLLTGQVTRGNLPRLQTESVGDLANLQRRVANLAQASVVTLTGSGGVGKTRAAIEIGWLVVDEFVDGVWLVELAPVADPDLAVTAVASALGASLQPGSTMIESIVDWCLGRRMLLIVDNCEHVLEPVIEVVQAIVAGCPTVTIIATSREPLGVAGETVTRIASLEERYATELFVLRARSADAGFEPTAVDAEAIAGICRRLDGIPLAIELAAARIRSLSPAELLERLDDRFRLLRGGGRGGLERHQTLRATVAWSYQLLTGDARLLFDRLSVFAGSFDLAAAEAIGAGDDLDTYDIVDLLGDLVDKSMVIASRTERGTRYRLLETLRQYGEERLDDRGETTVVRSKHLDHFVSVAQRLERQWMSPEQAVAGNRFDDDWENIAAAHAWAITTGDIVSAHDLIGATSHFALTRVRRDQQEWVIRTMELAEATARRDSTTIVAQSYWALNDGDPDRAVALGELAIAADGPATDPDALRATLVGHMAAGRTERALEIATELRSTLPSLVDPIDRYTATFAILQLVDPATIVADADAALDAAHTVGGPSLIADVLRIAAVRWYFVDPPNFERVFAELDEAIRLNESVGTSPVWEWVILTWGRTVAGHYRAFDTLNETILRASDERQWAALDATLEAAPVLFARDAPTVAATVFGYLDGSPPPWGQSGLDIRAAAAGVVDAIPDNETHRARGAAMDRHEIVALTLETLEGNRPPGV